MQQIGCWLRLTMRRNTDTRYLSVDRAQRVFANDWVDFEANEYNNDVVTDLKFAAKWAKNYADFKRRVIEIDNSVRVGRGRIQRNYSLSHNASPGATAAHRWAIRLEAARNTVYRCIK
jgi:hypothetical protein